MTYTNPDYAPKYAGQPSLDIKDALVLPCIFHSGSPWDEAKRAEWFRITGTYEATTRVLCDHMRFVAAEHSPAVTDSCGCVFCAVDIDRGLERDMKTWFHWVRGEKIPCPRQTV